MYLHWTLLVAGISLAGDPGGGWYLTTVFPSLTSMLTSASFLLAAVHKYTHDYILLK